jgi:hypothetical protein
MPSAQVAKRKGEKYKLFWREDRADFVRLAAKFNALIVPFAAVGGDDAFDLFMVRRPPALPFWPVGCTARTAPKPAQAIYTMPP